MLLLDFPPLEKIEIFKKLQKIINCTEKSTTPNWGFSCLLMTTRRHVGLNVIQTPYLFYNERITFNEYQINHLRTHQLC